VLADHAAALECLVRGGDFRSVSRSFGAVSLVLGPAAVIIGTLAGSVGDDDSAPSALAKVARPSDSTGHAGTDPGLARWVSGAHRVRSHNKLAGVDAARRPVTDLVARAPLRLRRRDRSATGMCAACGSSPTGTGSVPSRLAGSRSSMS
jgi:hypothetical protein